MLSLKRCLLIITMLCTLTVALIGTSGVTYAQTTSQQTTHTAMQPGKTSMNIRTYWEGSVITLNPLETRIVAAGSYSATFLLSAIPVVGWWLGLSRGGAAYLAWAASDAYIHGQCLWIWIDTFKPNDSSWGGYPCH